MFEDSVSSLPSIWATMSSWLTPTVLFVLLNIMIGTIAISSSLGNNKNKNQEQDTSHPRQLARSPSMLQRLKSINFHVQRSQESHAIYQDMNVQQASSQVQEQEQVHVQPFFTRSPSMLRRLKSIKLYSSYTSQEDKITDNIYSSHKIHQEDATPTTAEEQGHEFEEIEDNNNKNEEDMSIDEVYSHVNRTKSDTVPISGELLPKLPKKMKKSASDMSAFSHFEESDVVETRRPATVREGKAAAVEADAEVDAKADDFINKFKKQLKLQRLDSIIRYKEMITRGTAN